MLYRKQQYNTKLQEFNEKGATSPTRSPLPQASSTSPKKRYQALAESNAATPTLFAYDPVQDCNRQVPTSQAAAAANAKPKSSGPGNNPLTPSNWDGTTFYSLVDLRQRRVPKDIDWKNREQYLSPSDFQDAFHMTKEEFAKQPKWKRDKLKQGLYLF